MLGLIWSLLCVLSGFGLYLFSQRKTRVVKGWQNPSSGRQAEAQIITLTTPDSLQQAATFFSIGLKYVPFTRGNRTRLIVNSQGDGFDLPLIKLKGNILVTEEDIENFNLAVSRRFIRRKEEGENIRKKKGSTDSAAAPLLPLNPLFFVSFCTPLILHVLADHSCPIRPLGSVNTTNRFVFVDAPFCRDQKAILKASQDHLLSYTCSFGGSESKSYRRKRGIEFDITIIVKRGDQIVLEMQSSFLQFLSAKHPPAFDKAADDTQQKTNEKEQQQENVEGDNGENTTPIFMSMRHPHKWAAACSDYNPIHISPLAAKLFGFSSVIAHGNHAVALAVQDTLEDEESTKSKMSSTKTQARSLLNGRKFSLQIRFVRPVLLPTDLIISWVGKQDADDTKKKIKNEIGLEMRVKDRVSIVGELKA